MVANRSALNIIVSFLVFETASYWYRTLIWTYGSETVLNHPLFGVGLNDWERPAWMPAASIDNFWLYLAIRAGLPAAFLMLLAFLWIYLAVSLKKGLEGRLVEYRTGFLISMTGFFLVGWTGALLGCGLCSLSLPDGQRRLDAGCGKQGQSRLASEEHSSRPLRTVSTFDRVPQAWSTSGEWRCDDKHATPGHDKFEK